MKKNKTTFLFLKLFFFFPVILFFSCASLYNKYFNDWSIYQFKNEWNDPLKLYCVYYNGYIMSYYSHTFAYNERSFIKNLRFSKYEGLYFETHTDVSFMNLDNVTLYVKNLNNNIESSYQAQFLNKGSYGVMLVPFSENLADSLCNDNVSIRFITPLNYRCIFNFPTRFKLIYNKLKHMTDPPEQKEKENDHSKP